MIEKFGWTIPEYFETNQYVEL